MVDWIGNGKLRKRLGKSLRRSVGTTKVYRLDARKSRSQHKAKKIKSPPSQVQKFN